MKVLSLFSGCGGMDLGFEGAFTCLKKSINTSIHPDWICASKGEWVELEKTMFETVFANDIRKDARSAWINFFNSRGKNASTIYHLESIVEIVKIAHGGGAQPTT